MVKFPDPEKTILELQQEAADVGAILQYNCKTCRTVIADFIVSGFRPLPVGIKQ